MGGPGRRSQALRTVEKQIADRVSAHGISKERVLEGAIPAFPAGQGLTGEALAQLVPDGDTIASGGLVVIGVLQELLVARSMAAYDEREDVPFSTFKGSIIGSKVRLRRQLRRLRSRARCQGPPWSTTTSPLLPLVDAPLDGCLLQAAGLGLPKASLGQPIYRNFGKAPKGALSYPGSTRRSQMSTTSLASIKIC